MQTPDIFFLSYSESNAELHWQNLVARFPRAKRLHGVCGVYRAHALLAETSESDFYFVVDGDNLVHDDFDFSVPFVPEKKALYVWRARNPVNQLVYGFGGIKLYNRTLFQKNSTVGADVATTITPHYVPVMTLASTTCFNASPLESWRGAFRECAKLTQNIFQNPKDVQSQERLHQWLTVGAEAPFGSWCLLGANLGHSYAKERLQKQQSLVEINDFTWLKSEFLKNQSLTKITTDSLLPNAL